MAGQQAPEVITGRALAPIARVIELFGRALKNGVRVLLYKGPDAEREIEEAAAAARKAGANLRIVLSYELPESAGTRNIVEIRR